MPNTKYINTLLAEGNYPAAIEMLSEANRQQPDSAREQLLAELRLRGFQNKAPEKGPGNWPPGFDDPFKDVEGIPEIDCTELDLNSLASGIQNHGSLIVRNLIPDTQAPVLTQDIDQILMARDAYLDGADARETAPWFSPPKYMQEQFKHKRKFTSTTGGVHAVDSPRAVFRVLDLYHQLGLKELLSRYFGETPCIAGSKWVLRRMDALPMEIDWHQDGSFMGSDVRSVNVWLALSHCGGGHDSCGLDLIPKRLNHIVPTGTEKAIFSWAVSQQYVKREFSDTPPACPAFAPGDALLFDHFNLHRTSYSPTMQQHRYAIECWFFASSRYGEKQLPMLF